MRRFVIAALAVAASVQGPNGAAAEPLDILVYGATGKVGSLVVDEALERGHRVTAVSRNPLQIERVHPRLSAVRGDLLDTDSIQSLAAGQDVVVVSVRGIIGDSKSPESALQFLATERLVPILRDMGDAAPRLIHVGGAGSLEVEPGVLYADKLPRFFLPKKLELEIDGQVLVLELLRQVRDVAWTYITPPKNFTNGDRKGVYRIGGDRMLEDHRGRNRISRADFAMALIDEAENGAHIRQRFSVAY